MVHVPAHVCARSGTADNPSRTHTCCMMIRSTSRVSHWGWHTLNSCSTPGSVTANLHPRCGHDARLSLCLQQSRRSRLLAATHSLCHAAELRSPRMGRRVGTSTLVMTSNSSFACRTHGFRMGEHRSDLSCDFTTLTAPHTRAISASALHNNMAKLKTGHRTPHAPAVCNTQGSEPPLWSMRLACTLTWW